MTSFKGLQRKLNTLCSTATLSEQTWTSSFARQPCTTILVGPDRIAYHLHKDIVCRHSPYLSTALKESWNENATEVHLNDFAPEDFDLVVYWMYKDKIPDHLLVEINADESPDQLPSEEPSEIDMRLVDMYKVADMLMMSDLQNTIIDTVFSWMEKSECCWPWSSLIHLLERELWQTCFWKLAVKSFIENADCEENLKFGFDIISDDLADYPEATRDLFVQLLKYRRQEWTALSRNTLCDFHIHPDGKKCGGLSKSTD